MVARTCLNVASYVHWLSRFFFQERESLFAFIQNSITLLHQADGRRTVISEAGILSQASPFWICWGQSGTTYDKIFFPQNFDKNVSVSFHQDCIFHTHISFSLHGLCVMLAIDSVVKWNVSFSVSLSLSLCHVMLLVACAVASLLFAIKLMTATGQHSHARMF